MEFFLKLVSWELGFVLATPFSSIKNTISKKFIFNYDVFLKSPIPYDTQPRIKVNHLKLYVIAPSSLGGVDTDRIVLCGIDLVF